MKERFFKFHRRKTAFSIATLLLLFVSLLTVQVSIVANAATGDQVPLPSPGFYGSFPELGLEVWLTEPMKYPYGSAPVEKKLVSLIDSAKSTISITTFDMDNSRILAALLRAHLRGVRIRIIADPENVPKEVLKAFEGYGWRIPYKPKKLMHQKLFIIDSLTVVAGSMNHTVRCMYLNNNDMLVLYGSGIGRMFQRYFDLLAAEGRGEKPDASLAESFQSPVKSGDCTVYFTHFPTYDINASITSLIGEARQRIYFAYSTFTNDKIADLIIGKAKGSVIRLFGLFDKGNTLSEYSVYKRFIQANQPVYTDTNDYLMHHKLLVVDEKILIGSYAIANRFNGKIGELNGGASYNDEVSFLWNDRALTDFFAAYLERLVFGEK